MHAIAHASVVGAAQARPSLPVIVAMACFIVAIAALSLWYWRTR